MTGLVSNFLPVYDSERPVDVSRWYTSAGRVECTTISGAIAYEHLISEQVYMLVYHQVVYCERPSNHLMCPMQSFMAGVNINELPEFLAEDSYEKTHAIIVSDPLNPNQPLIIHLVLKGATGYLPSSNPRASKNEDQSIPHINMTSKAPVSETSESSFSDFRGKVISNKTISR